MGGVEERGVTLHVFHTPFARSSIGDGLLIPGKGAKARRRGQNGMVTAWSLYDSNRYIYSSWRIRICRKTVAPVLATNTCSILDLSVGWGMLAPFRRCIVSYIFASLPAVVVNRGNGLLKQIHRWL